MQTQCPTGTYNPNVTGTSLDACSACGVGYYCEAGSEAETGCARGTFGNETGLNECLTCEAGSFQGKEGQAACEACPVGGYCEDVGAVQARPTPCPPGTWSNKTGLKSADECDPCPAGGGARHLTLTLTLALTLTLTPTLTLPLTSDLSPQPLPLP